jgi:hypothetical protein
MATRPGLCLLGSIVVGHSTARLSHTGKDEHVVEPVVAALAAMPVKEIHAFQERLAQKLYGNLLVLMGELASAACAVTTAELVSVVATRRHPHEGPTLSVR